MFYAPHPGRFPGEHSSSALGHAPKVARLTTVTTVLENLRKYSNYTLQVRSTVICMHKYPFKTCGSVNTIGPRIQYSFTCEYFHN